jgi:hypothetical protein
MAERGLSCALDLFEPLAHALETSGMAGAVGRHGLGWVLPIGSVSQGGSGGVVAR